MPDVLLTSLTGLKATSRQIQTVGHNLANATTAGYSRQDVQLRAQTPSGAAWGYIGNGVLITDVRRSYDRFIEANLRDSNSDYQRLYTFLEAAVRVEDVVADPKGGVGPSMQDFFNAWQDVADNPALLSNRTVLLEAAGSMVDRFYAIDERMSQIDQEIDDRITDAVNQFNALAENLASINGQIDFARSNGIAGEPNDLLDQRDQILKQMNELIGGQIIEDQDRRLSFQIGKGQPAVYHLNAFELRAEKTQDGVRVLFVDPNGTDIDITDDLKGGAVDGLFQVREELLNPARNELGRVAKVLADEVNLQHYQGLDLNGQLGGTFFEIGEPEVFAAVRNTNSYPTLPVSASFSTDLVDAGQLTGDDYEARWDGANWQITNLSSKTTTSYADGPQNFDGLSVTLNSAGVATGDSFTIAPTRNLARTLTRVIDDAREVAAAGVAYTQTGANNAGTAAISNPALLTVSDDALAAGASTKALAPALVPRLDAGDPPANTLSTTNHWPVTLTFDETTNQFNLSFGASGATASVAYNPANDDGTAYVVDVPDLGRFEFNITGVPRDNDQFEFRINTGGQNDNRNALKVAELNTKKVVEGTQSLLEAHDGMVADVGARTRAAEINEGAAKGVVDQLTARREEISGVNLDEEAANLLRFQQAYQAISQTIAASNRLFDALLGAVGG